MSQLSVDCLHEIFEYFEDFENCLHSCLLVNHLWCEVSVRILWRSRWKYRTLIACLPNESKEILYENGIIISPPTSKPLMFNYVSFCKELSFHQFKSNIDCFLRKRQSIANTESAAHTLMQEMTKLLINQASLRKLHFDSSFIPIFTSFPGANDCLKNLSELRCRSDHDTELFYQLSKICYNMKSLDITFVEDISNGLLDLISAQQNLKCLRIIKRFECKDLTNIIKVIALSTKLPDTLLKLNLFGEESQVPFSFIAKFIYLQEIELSFYEPEDFEEFEKLQYVTFSQLQVLNFPYGRPRNELLIKFLENNGKNLTNLCLVKNINPSLNLAIVEFCPNLRSLNTEFKKNELETLKMIFNSCQYLKYIEIWCRNDDYLNEKELLEIVAEYSPKNFDSLILEYRCKRLGLILEELELFFISWANRIPKIPLWFLIHCPDDETLDFSSKYNYYEIISDYMRLGIIKGFGISYYDREIDFF